jgi:RimJ/RimL family protein N-acetyltransferase
VNKIVSQFTSKTGKIISFRYPTIDDVEILKDYINKISDEQSFILFQGRQTTLESETKWLEDKLEKIDQKKCVYFCGIYQNKLVACAEITMHTDAKAHVGNFGITVREDLRGEGIGEAIMKLVIEESVKNIPDLKIIDLEVFGKNKIAKNLYSKLGFIEYGKLPSGLKRKGKLDDAILMYKKIR